jgi:hypothetical protein
VDGGLSNSDIAAPVRPESLIGRGVVRANDALRHQKCAPVAPLQLAPAVNGNTLQKGKQY